MCSEREQSRGPWHPQEGAPNPASRAFLEVLVGRGDHNLEEGRAVQTREGLLGFWNREFDVTQKVAFKLILDCSPQ